MSGGEDSAVHEMQPTALQAQVHRVPAHAQGEKLPTGDNAVLSTGQISDLAIDLPCLRGGALRRRGGRLAAFCAAFARHAVVNAALVRHGADAAGDARASGAPKVKLAPTSARKRGSSPPVPPLALIP
jgi:hypothetical protein